MKDKLQMTNFKYSKLIIIICLVLGACYLVLTFQRNVHAQSTNCSASYSNRAQGLISTPTIASGSKVGTLANSCIIDSKASFAPYKLLSYDVDLKPTYYTQSKSKNPAGINASSSITAINNNLVDNYSSANVAVGALNYTGTSVIFVDKALTITGNICSSSPCSVNTVNTNGLVLVVGGDINIAPGVTQIDAVLISSGTIYTAAASGATCTTNAIIASALTINGSLISLNPSQKIQFCRSLGGGSDSTNPAEIINQQAKYLVLLRNLFAQPLQIWSELQ